MSIFQLFKINKNIQDTLSLCVTRNGTAHSSQYFANSFIICFADRNLLTLESLSHGLCSKCTDLIEKSCTCLLRTGGSPMSFMSFVNFSQFNLVFHEFRNCLMLIFMNSFLLKKTTVTFSGQLLSFISCTISIMPFFFSLQLLLLLQAGYPCRKSD